jgi:hypothetical protein
VIRVDACNDEEAIGKIIRAGAMTCRNRKSPALCDANHPAMSPLPEKQLREVVRMMMNVGASSKYHF